MNELALFAGAGGGILAGELLGWRGSCMPESTKKGEAL
jgi:DNA (cytosine-5)-methyltransferase 1